MAEAVVIGDLELDFVTGLVIEESRKLVVHRWPGEDGDIVQDMGAAAARISLTGVAVGDAAGDRLEQLRKAMQSGEPQDFAASAAVASGIEQVMIAALRVMQPPGQLNYYEYRMELVRYVPPPPPPSMFDVGALGDIAAEIDTSIFDALGDAAGLLGTVQGAVQAIDDALDMAKSAVELVKDGVQLVAGLKVIEEVLSKAGQVISASAD